MRNVLIGKDRRVTLEELESVAFHDGQLEMHASSDNNDNDAAAAQEDVAGITTALTNLTVQDENSSLLSSSETLAVLTLFALNLSQNRIMPASNNSIEAAAAIVQLVNTSKSSSSSQSSLRLSSSASCFLSTLITLIPTYKCVIDHLSNPSLSKSHFLPILNRCIPLAITSLSTIQTANLTSNSLIDAFAALSVERSSIDATSVYSSSKYDIQRPHRGMMSSASVVRVITQGSKVSTKTSILPKTNDDSISSDVMEAIKSIPAYHGPVCDVIPTAKKVLELECNCFELSGGGDMDPTVIELTSQTVDNACQVLLNGAYARIGTTSSTNSPKKESN